MNENQEAKQKYPWYFRTSVLVMLFLSVGPLALPLFWVNPRFSCKLKIIVTTAIVILSILVWSLAANAVKILSAYLEGSV